jgi:hypothetical protein
MTIYALVFPVDQIREYVDTTPEWIAAHVPKASTGGVYKQLIVAAPVDLSTPGNPKVVTEVVKTFQPTTVTSTSTTRDLLATEFNLTGPQWFALVKGLPGAQRTLLRDTVTNNMAAAAPSDALTDAQFVAAKQTKKAAAYLANEETDKNYDDVILALSKLSPAILLTGPQTTNFQARWQEVGRV